MRDNGQTILLIANQNSLQTSKIRLPDLRSRLAWGLVLQLNELDDEAKITTLQQQASLRGFELPYTVASFLIARCARNLHDLHHLLDKLDRASLAAHRKITIPFVKSILAI